MLNLFVRIKGRVQGPFDHDKLRAMARRGQLSRIHEVSEDNQSWGKKAGDFPEIFQAASTTGFANQPVENQSQQPSSERPPVGKDPGPPNTDNVDWYLEEDGESGGPYSFSELQRKFRTGKLDPANLVCQEGMSDWIPADSVDGLVSVSVLIGRMNKQESETDSPPDAHTIAILGNSRGWIIFCAIVSVIWAIAFCVAGFVGLIQGAKVNSTTDVLVSILIFGLAIVSLVGGYLLLSYSSSIFRLRIEQDSSSLNAALGKLHRIWMFIGGILIVGIIFFIVIFVLDVAIADEPSLFFRN